MKKLLALLLCMLMCLCALPAGAEDMSGEFELPWWCMLRYDFTLLTAVLPVEDVTECVWSIEISDESVLTLMNFEVLGDDPMESDEPLWIINFAPADRAGTAMIQLTQTRGGEHIQTNFINVTVHTDGTMDVTQAMELLIPYPKDLHCLQVGAFASAENAQNCLQRLAQAGFDGLVKYDGTLYRVQAGAFAVEANALAQLAALKEAGFEDAFISTRLTGEIVYGADAFHPPFFTYTVGKDDTMWGIARTFLGDGRRWEEIAEINGIGMEIYVGQLLLIPY